MMMRKRLVVVAALVALFADAASAYAVDAPKWVAALYIQAQSAVGLRWNPVAGASGYKVQRSTTAGSGHVELASIPQPQYIDLAVEAGTTYYYRLLAVAGAEASPASDEKIVVIPGVVKKEALQPPAIKDPVLSQTVEFGKASSKIVVAWASSTGGKAIAYNLYRSTVAGKDYQMVGSTTENQMVDTGVEIGKTYYYSVVALDEGFQETPRSVEKSITVTEPAKREEKKEKKEKTALVLRGAKVLASIKEGSWGSFKEPIAVQVNSNGELVVLDSYNTSVFVFDGNREFLFRFGEGGIQPGQIKKPLDMVLDPDDNIYISNSDPRVEIFNSKGVPSQSVTLAAIIGDDGKAHGIGGIATGPDSWFISDDTDHKVYEVAYKTNKLIRKIGGTFDPTAKGDMPLGEFRSPKKLYYSTKHKALVVADTFNFRIQVIGDDGKMAAFGTFGSSVGQFNRIIGLCEDEAGGIFAPDFGNSTVQDFEVDGKFKYVLAVPDLTGQFALGGTTGCVIRDKIFYLAEKTAGMVTVGELTDNIGALVKKK